MCCVVIVSFVCIGVGKFLGMFSSVFVEIFVVEVIKVIFECSGFVLDWVDDIVFV